MIVFVTGAPCSGKSTWVAKHAAPDDAVWDYDRVLPAICGKTNRGRPAWHVPVMMALREAFVRAVANMDAYVICTAATEAKRQEIAGNVRCRWIFVNPGRKVCLERSFDRPNRSELVSVINRFYTEIETDGMEEVDSSK